MPPGGAQHVGLREDQAEPPQPGWRARSEFTPLLESPHERALQDRGHDGILAGAAHKNRQAIDGGHNAEIAESRSFQHSLHLARRDIFLPEDDLLRRLWLAQETPLEAAQRMANARCEPALAPRAPIDGKRRFGADSHAPAWLDMRGGARQQVLPAAHILQHPEAEKPA